MSNINIYVSDVSGEETNYTFFLDSSGTHELLPKNSLFLNNTYTFFRLNDTSSNPFYISDNGYEQSHSSDISLVPSNTSRDEDDGIIESESLILKFKGISKNDNLTYYDTSNSEISGNFNLLVPSAVFNKGVQFKDLIDVSGRSILHGGLTSYGQVAVGKATPDISFAMDVSGKMNCSELLINGEEPLFGGNHIKLYENEVSNNSFIKTYNETTAHHPTWSIDPSHLTYTIGNVGIGTHNPDASYSLDVSGTVKINNNLSIGDVIVQDLSAVLDVSGFSKFYGAVGIGIDEPSGEFLLDVSGKVNCMELLIDGKEPLFGSQNIKVYDNSSISFSLEEYKSVTNHITWSADVSKVTYTKGNVGIGTNNIDASYVLDVSGALKVNNNISIGDVSSLDLSKVLDVSGISRFTGLVGVGPKEHDPSDSFIMDICGNLNCTNLFVNGEVPLFGSKNIKVYEDVSTLNLETNFETVEHFISWSASENTVHYDRGTVGIGTSNVDTSYVLDVSGAVLINQNLSIGISDDLDTSKILDVSGVSRFTGLVGVGPKDHDPSSTFVMDICGNLNCTDLFVRGKAPIFGSQNIKVYDSSLSSGTFTTSYEGTQDHHDTWATAASHVSYTNGNVGIGVSVPDASFALDISGDTIMRGDLHLVGDVSGLSGSGANLTGIPNIALDHSVININGIDVSLGGSIITDVCASQWIDGGSDISTIHYNEGIVGIGTDSPDTSYVLDVSGAVKINQNLSIGISDDLDVSAALDVSGLTLFTGPVGIGTREPSGTFLMDISGMLNCAALFVNGSEPEFGSKNIKIYDSSSITIDLNTSYKDVSNQITWSATESSIKYTHGNVGIGVDPDPSFLLDVSGSLNCSELLIDGKEPIFGSQNIKVYEDVSTLDIITSYEDVSNFVSWSVDENSVYYNLGTVGIGTSDLDASAVLDVCGSAFFKGDYFTYNAGTMAIGISGVDNIDTSAVLDVSGTTRFTGLVSVGPKDHEPSGTFAMDICGNLNCTDLFVRGKAPIFGSQNIKVYDSSLSSGIFTTSYEGTQDHHDTWATAASHVSYTNGNVGIGVTVPDASFVLDISGDTIMRGDLHLVGDVSGLSGSGANLTGIPNIALDHSIININGIDVSLGGSIITDVCASQWIDGGSDISTIHYNEGSVGIGTDSPDTSYVLDVSGSVKINQNLSIGISGDLDVSAALDVSGLSLFTGPVGIGTREPSGEFLMDISGMLNCAALFVNGSEPEFGSKNIKIYDSSSITIDLNTSYKDVSNQITWSATESSIKYTHGNVGIGAGLTNPDPSYSLDVSGSLNCSELLIDGKEPLFGSQNIKVYENVSTLDISTSYEDVSNFVSWSADENSVYYNLGTVGIGTSDLDASAVLDVSGSAFFKGDYFTYNAGTMAIGISGVENIDTSAVLDVSGTTRFTGLVSVGPKDHEPSGTFAMDICGNLNCTDLFVRGKAPIFGSQNIKVYDSSLSSGTFTTSYEGTNAIHDTWATSSSHVSYTNGSVLIGKSGLNTDASFALDVSGNTIISGDLHLVGDVSGLSGSGANLTGIPNSALDHSIININGIDVSLGGSIITDVCASQWIDGGSDISTIHYNEGSVGIGTDSPDTSYVLDVSGDTIILGELQVIGDISGSGANLTGIPNSALDHSIININGIDVSLGGSIITDVCASQWIDGGSDISTIHYNEGSVGIGTDSPDTSYVLDVSGAVKINQNLSIGISGDLDVSAALDVSGLSLFTGPVGIGTREPSGEFLMDVNGMLNCAALFVNGAEPEFGSTNIKIYDSSSITIDLNASYKDVSNQITWSATESSIKYTNGTVGIGAGLSNPDPSYSLDVSGIMNCSELLIDGKEPLFGSQNIKVYEDVSTLDISTSYEDVSNFASWSADENSIHYTQGNVGIGTSDLDPSAVLDVSGSAFFKGDYFTYNDGTMAIGISGVDNIDTSSVLDVSGTTRFTGLVSVGPKDHEPSGTFAMDICGNLNCTDLFVKGKAPIFGSQNIKVYDSSLSSGTFTTSYEGTNTIHDTWATASSHVSYTNGSVLIGKSDENTDASFALDVSGNIIISGDLHVIGDVSGLSGSGANLTGIPNSALDHSMININGIDVSLGGSIITDVCASQWIDGGSDISTIHYNEGSVGIGTDSPDTSYVLDVSGDLQVIGDISGSGANLTGIPNSALDHSIININGIDVSLGGSIITDVCASQWIDGGSDISTIHYNEGSVGIGTDSPDTSYVLDVSGAVKISGDVSFSNQLNVSGITSLHNGLNVIGDVSFSDNLFVEGRVGIGKSYPDASYALDVSGLINCNDVYVNGVLFEGTGSGETNNIKQYDSFSNGFDVSYDTGPIVHSTWSTGPSKIVYNNGNVGIGTSDPNFMLHVDGSINCTQLFVNGDEFQGSGGGGGGGGGGGDFTKEYSDDISFATSYTNLTNATFSVNQLSINDLSEASIVAKTNEATTFSNNLTVTGLTDLNGGLDVSGDVSFNSGLDVTGGLTVDGLTDLNGGLDVSGDVSFNSGLDVTGGLTVDGLTDLNGGLDVAGDVSFNNNLTVSENLIVDGDISGNISTSNLTGSINTSTLSGTISDSQLASGINASKLTTGVIPSSAIQNVAYPVLSNIQMSNSGSGQIFCRHFGPAVGYDHTDIISNRSLRLQYDTNLIIKKNAVEHARFDDNGFFRIGASSSAAAQCPLHIYATEQISQGNFGQSNINLNNNRRIYFGFAGNNTANTTQYVGSGNTLLVDNYALTGQKDSIHAAGSIITERFITAMRGTVSSSDSRIKSNITDISDNEALRLCNQLKPKRYTYTDVVNHGTSPVIGFIAQEVKEEIPEAVIQRTEYIPNIYQLATVSGEILTFSTDLSLSSITDVSSGKVKIYDISDKEHYVDISSATSNTMTLSNPSQITHEMQHENQIFVFGERVPDFHTLKKEMIIPIAVGAIQEVDRQLTAEKVKTAALETDLAAEKTKVATLQSQLAAIESRLSALESA